MYRYTVTRYADRCEFRPSDTFVFFLVCCWAAGITLLVALASFTESFFRVVFLAGAGLLAVGIMWALSTRRTPLTVGPAGRVALRDRELCAAGTVRWVLVADARTGESGDCEVCFELDEGKRVYLPSSSIYLGNFRDRQEAYSFAAELAAALDVAVTYPGAAPLPTNTLCHRCATLLLPKEGSQYGDDAPEVTQAIASHGRVVRRGWRSGYPQEGGETLFECQDCHGWWGHRYWSCVPQEALYRYRVESVAAWVAEQEFGKVET